MSAAGEVICIEDLSKKESTGPMWLCEVMKSVGKPRMGPSSRPKMQKVPDMLREVQGNRSCYEPVMVSIGPYHHRVSKLQKMEKLKMTMAHQYARGIKKETDEECKRVLDDLYAKVLNVVSEARQYYVEGDLCDYNDESFAKMMFLDGCFLIQFIYCITERKLQDLDMESRHIVWIHRDLCLLENQLPFSVLKALMSLRFKVDRQNEMFNKFVECTVGGDFHSQKRGRPQAELLHLLELIRTKLVGYGSLEDKYTQEEPHVIMVTEWCAYRSVKELMSVGVHFKPSKSRCCTDVTFEEGYFSALLTLPPIILQDSTKSLLLNLAAYEACPDTPDDLGVTSYICFMDLLLDQAEDARKLRENGILLNTLVSDQEVANTFNEMAINLVPDPLAYKDIIPRIQTHCDKKSVLLNKWTYTYFKRPWAAIIFSGATVTIALTIIQTVSGLLTSPNSDTH